MLTKQLLAGPAIVMMFGRQMKNLVTTVADARGAMLVNSDVWVCDGRTHVLASNQNCVATMIASIVVVYHHRVKPEREASATAICGVSETPTRTDPPISGLTFSPVHHKPAVHVDSLPRHLPGALR